MMASLRSSGNEEERYKMIARREAGIVLIVISLFLILGCGREKPKNDFELGKAYFSASS